MSRTTESALAVRSTLRADLNAVPEDARTVPNLADRLITLAAEDERLTREALELPGAVYRREAAVRCRIDHGRVLREIVDASGWPSCSAVGEAASIAAVQILLHSGDLELMSSCQERIASAVEAKASPAIHLAYVEDACAVLQGRRQKYGTQIDPKLLRPYPIEDPERVGERRQEVGLPPLREVVEHHLGLLKQAQ
ncbi:DUF6624 domain-containing protein [Streptomyces sp. NPDC052016]|uniref:DUF6624 domain-containing protein n=1 Tax=Streptomyces sp. NPDC052016 TaxID=3365680 RepID=UPI0037CE142F